MDFLVPKLSATMETVKVLRWLKRAGDKVAMGEPLVELETDKATMEVESPVDAMLDAVMGGEGEELSVGAVLARLRTLGEATSASEPNSTVTSATDGARRGARLPDVSVFWRGAGGADPRVSIRKATRQSEWG